MRISRFEFSLRTSSFWNKRPWSKEFKAMGFILFIRLRFTIILKATFIIKMLHSEIKRFKCFIFWQILNQNSCSSTYSHSRSFFRSGSNQGPRWDFRIVGADFSVCSKTEDKGTFEQKSRVQNQVSSKSVGAKSVILKIYGCSCTHCTHTNGPGNDLSLSKFVGR